jgi:hypothetical protein
VRAATAIRVLRTVRATVSSQSPSFQGANQGTARRGQPYPAGTSADAAGLHRRASPELLTLWKPTIDALGPILGYTPSAGPWSPLDGRIVDLGLHCRVNPPMGNDVIITIAATSIRA